MSLQRNCILCGSGLALEEHTLPFEGGYLCESCTPAEARAVRAEAALKCNQLHSTPKTKAPPTDGSDLFGRSYDRWLEKELGYGK